MKRITRSILISGLLLINIIISAQTVSFGYDDAGNRISRTITLKSSEINQTDSTDQLVEKQHFFDFLNETKITISPNPNGGRFSVEVESKGSLNFDISQVQLSLYNMSGERIYYVKELSPFTEIDISKRQNGTYILTFLSEKDRRTWKIIKQ